jgi:hypothetical protein
VYYVKTWIYHRSVLVKFRRRFNAKRFFKSYLKQVGGSDNSVIIDSTSLPNQINIDFNAWGRSDGKIETQFKLLCVVDQVRKIPIYYRFLPGNLNLLTVE